MSSFFLCLHPNLRSCWNWTAGKQPFSVSSYKNWPSMTGTVVWSVRYEDMKQSTLTGFCDVLRSVRIVLFSVGTPWRDKSRWPFRVKPFVKLTNTFAHHVDELIARNYLPQKVKSWEKMWENKRWKFVWREDLKETHLTWFPQADHPRASRR